MSYDLELFREKGSAPLTAEEIRKTAALMPHMEVSESQLIFDMPNSEHSIIFDIEDISEEDREPSYEASGITISMHIAYGSVRATMNTASRICDFLARKLNLIYYDPQGDLEMPMDTFASDVTWWKGEKKVISILQQMRPSMQTVKLPDDSIHLIREYSANLDAIEGKWVLGNFYVPKIVVIRSTETGVASTAVVWTDFLPIVFPDVEYVVTRFKGTGIVKFADIKAVLGEWISRYSRPMRHYLCRPDKYREILANAPRLQLLPLEQFELVPESELPLTGGQGGLR